MNKKIIALHILFWIAIMAVALYFKVVIHFFSTGLIISTFLDISLLAILSYLNIYLIKQFYEKRKVAKYWLLVSGFGLAIAFMRYVLEIAIFESFNIPFQHFSSRVMPAKLLTTLIFIGISFAYYLSVNYLKRKQEAYQNQAQLMQLELEFHKARVNPHFLFNTLGNIHALILQKSDQAADVVLELSDLMRYMFYDCQENKVPINNEIEFIHSLIKLYRIRSTSKLNIIFEKNIRSEINIEPLLFVSFIENAFKHGNVYQGGELLVSFTEKNNELHFLCKNTYQPNIHTSTNKQSGFGVDNVKKRLYLLYPNKHQLTVKTEGNEFIVILKLNLKNESKI